MDKSVTYPHGEIFIVDDDPGAASIKETGISLGISPKAVAVHRQRIMRKLGAKNSVNLVRTVMNTARQTGA
jgi:sRNA-binding carbon storage regulator CsrA